jgi:hypothetical protein
VLYGVTLLFAIGLGTTTVSNQTALYLQAPAAHVGTPAGLFRTFGYLGFVASSIITGVVFRREVTEAGVHTVADGNDHGSSGAGGERYRPRRRAVLLST